ncbi:MAG: FliH/SctL family protein [Alphaproteobacteria bacterium]
MTDKALQGKKQKYFFNANIFDDDHVEEPAAPVFTEEELAAARQKSMAEGKTAGLKEAEASQLKQTSLVLEKIQKQLTEISAAEAMREKVFEAETVRLTLSIFEQIFPLYNAHAGFAELKENLSEILKKQEGQSHLSITVTPDVAPRIEEHLNSLKNAGIELRFSVKGDPALLEGACRMAWSEGGALLDRQKLADDVRAAVQQVLAKKALTGHDGGNESGADGEIA